MAKHRRIVVLYVVVLTLYLRVHLTNKNSKDRLQHLSLRLVRGVHLPTKSKMRGTSHAVSKTGAAHWEESWSPTGRTYISVPRNISFRILLSCQLEGTQEKTCSIVTTGLRFNSIVIPGDRNFSKLVDFNDLTSEFFELQRCALLIRLQSSTPQKIPFACEQNMRQDVPLPTVQETFLLNWFPMETHIFIHVHPIDIMYSSQLPDSFVLESRFPLCELGHTITDSEAFPNRTIALPKPAGVLGDFGHSRKRHFPRFRLLSAIFSSHNWPYKNSSREGSFIDTALLNNAFKEILIVTVCLLKIIYECLSHTEETKNPCKNVKRPLQSFSSKSKWEDLKIALKEVLQTVGRDERKSSYSKSLFSSNSILETLNEYIFRPWLHKAQLQCSESCLKISSTPNNCASFDSSPCASCLQHLENFTSTQNPPVSIQVSPATRFLPDPTLDPAVDLAHVGYRLATLGALPASVPTSRIKLADAGFYFRGQGDEVICYSCGARHSGWRREDSPMDIHRRLSPECSHVLQRVPETAALSDPQSSSSDATSAGRETEVRPPPQAHSNAPVEDGENPPPSARPEVAAPAATRQGTQLPQNHPIPNGCLPVSHASSGSVTESLVISGASAAERTPTTAPGANGTIPNSHTNGVTDTGNLARSASSGTNNVAGNVTTCTADTRNGSTASSTSTDSRPSQGASSSSHGNHGNAARSEPRPLFPRAGLDLGGAVYPMYQDMASRRRTFTQWDDSQAPPLDHVILCGMFYAGYADCVRCFYCGVGLKHWVPTDDVWTEHVRWRPGCEYLRAVKGDDFIRETQRRLGIESGGSGQNRGSGRSDAAQSSSRQQQQQPTTTTPSNTSSISASSRTAAAATTTATNSASSQSARTVPSAQLASHSGQTSRASTPATTTAAVTATTSGSGQTSQTSSATATTTGGSQAAVATTSSGATATSTTPSSPRCSRSNQSGSGGGSGSNVVVAPSASEEHERLSRLQAENRALSQRLQCRVCRHAAIDTILMPCGHLVLCETCAGSVTSCPLCHDDIRATAKVHMA